MSWREAIDRTAPELYLEVRGREDRLLSADEARQLPHPAPSSPFAEEWAMRRDALRRVVRWLRQSTGRGPILDLGCGVGWMAARLAAALDRPVIGVDVNERELDVARTAFGSDPRLRFVRADIFSDEVPGGPFETMVVAAALQYFSDPGKLLSRLAELGEDGGEILIFDSPIYDSRDVEAARRRSRSYYESLGVPGMAERYHHHDWGSLAPYRPEIVYRPRRWVRWVAGRLGRPRSPFPILRIAVAGLR